MQHNLCYKNCKIKITTFRKNIYSLIFLQVTMKKYFENLILLTLKGTKQFFETGWNRDGIGIYSM
jgi:hypothetical protein